MFDKMVKVTNYTLIEQDLNEKLKETQEMEWKLQKLANTMDYLEMAKRVEETQLIEAAYQKNLVDDEIFFEKQQVNLILILYRIFTLCSQNIYCTFTR